MAESIFNGSKVSFYVITKSEYDKIENRKNVGLKSLPRMLAEHPRRLAAYSPDDLKKESSVTEDVDISEDKEDYDISNTFENFWD